MSVNDVDDTLLSYFKQMLEEESANCVTDTNDKSDDKTESAGAPQEETAAMAETVSGAETLGEESAEDVTTAQTAETDETLSCDNSDEGSGVLSSETPVDGSSAETSGTVEEAAPHSETPSDGAEDSSVENITYSQESEAAPETADAIEPSFDAKETGESIEAESLDTTEQESSDPETSADLAMEEGTLDEAQSDESSQSQETAPLENALSDGEDVDYAADDYEPPKSEPHEPVLERAKEPEVAEPLPFAEHKSLETLLEAVPKQQLLTEVKVAEEVKTETKVETVAVDKVKDTVKAEVKKTDDEKKSPYDWTNIEMPEEFQVLFFLVKGIRFAVPLVNLGGIVQCDKVTPLFGKPDWFQGVADIRGKKMCVVDTLKWVKSDAPKSDKYEYMIVLDDTIWSVGCDTLEGNKILSKDCITWRQTAGNRPWLAGIVKQEMCALLHVSALIKMFENGVNLKDLDKQMRA